jgi:hypothetical protein
MSLSKILGLVTIQGVATILATGLLLNLANQGTLGTFVKGIANKVTNGYGAGPVN